MLDANPAPVADEPLFSLGDDMMTVGDVDAYRQSMPFLRLRETPAHDWLEAAVMNRLLLWHARQTDLASDAAVAAEIEAAEREAMARLGAEYYLEKRIEERVSSGALEEYYEQNYKRFQTPLQYQLRLITVDFAGTDRPYDVFEFLEQIGEEIRSGRRAMADAARDISNDPSASDGGLTPWMLLEGIASWAGPRAQHMIMGLEVGELSEPILVERYDQSELSYKRQGYMLARIEAIQHPTVRTFEEAYVSVVQRYTDIHRVEFETETRDEVFATIDARILEENL